MNHIKLISLMALLSSANQTFAQSQTSPKDSVKEERNVMLNASDATKPREIPIGLPSSDVTVYENGLPAVYSSSLHSLSAHWRSDMGQAGVGLMNPMESAIATGNIAYSVVSSLKTGEERFKGVLNYQGNHFGWNQFDLNVSGPLGKGWYYAGTMYQSFDPGTFKLQFTDFQDRMQLYRGVITHKWGKENELGFIYKYTNDRLAGYLASTAPFIYVGDGSVKEVEGFALGTSSYLPVDGKIDYRDLMTGKEYDSNFRDGMGNHAHDIGISLKYMLANNWKLSANARYSHADVKSTTVGTTTITDVVNGREDGTDNSNLYYLNGELFTGKRQGSVSYYHEATVQNYLFTADLSKKWNGHDFKVGVNEWGYHVDYHSNTTMFDRTVEKYPSLIQHEEGGKMLTYYNYNSLGSERYRGFENKVAVYVSDRWTVSPKWEVFGGARLEYFHVGGYNLPYARCNDFVMGTTLADGTKVVEQKFSNDKLNYAFALQGICRLTPHFGLTADATMAINRPNISNYASTTNPSGQASRVPLLRGGVFYRNSWLNVTSMISYISKSDNYSLMNLSNPELNTDSRTVAFNYDVQTLGWTTSVETDPVRGLHVHFLLTLQEPKYNNYETTVSFGDKTYDVSATGKIVTNISKVLLEFDPSYEFNDYIKLWMSFRYFGKQYANLSNALYFNGHWETFAGVNVKVNKILSLHVNVVNFLNQTGATGTISGAELISASEAQKYNNHWMAGSYLRSFTVEFGAKLTF